MTRRHRSIAWTLFSLFFATRAARRGPKALARYATRRASRRLLYRISKGWLA